MSLEPNALAGAGVHADEEAILRALLTLPQATVDELSIASDQPPEQVAGALARLSGRGLVARLAGAQPQYTAADPRAALDALIHPAERALRRAREAAAELSALFHTARAERPVAGPVEVVTGREEISRYFVRIQQSAVRDVCAFDRPPYVHAVGNPVEPAILARGVRWRVVYHPDALALPGALADVRALATLGEQARVLTDVPFKMHLVDDRVAMVALDTDTATVRAALVYPSALLEALSIVFESCWQRATPLDGAAGEEEVSDEDRQLLALLAAGVKDDAIGRQLGLSVRTMRRRVRRLLDLLGAQTRFQAGMQAARRGWI
ncbi:helix-turn-helix domain-containing protein [Micromonospora polyrhachis]|uniref:DNA-binding CsgD family transcriptional regulator n=1 Tax=Micromonospora polyrhachis TaxID=1282883 RepID=A0A7W7SVT0_9ACTN|nr:helix-turn-helix domain-containing protein [Micromonospora polyrhachis]MBB4961793.1 DNA-binding CsgD family transcriptional regulator [Micromonospora polyrhachis]